MCIRDSVSCASGPVGKLQRHVLIVVEDRALILHLFFLCSPWSATTLSSRRHWQARPVRTLGTARKEMDGCTVPISGAIFFNRNLNYPVENKQQLSDPRHR